MLISYSYVYIVRIRITCYLSFLLSFLFLISFLNPTRYILKCTNISESTVPFPVSSKVEEIRSRKEGAATGRQTKDQEKIFQGRIEYERAVSRSLFFQQPHAFEIKKQMLGAERGGIKKEDGTIRRIYEETCRSSGSIENRAPLLTRRIYLGTSSRQSPRSRISFYFLSRSTFRVVSRQRKKERRGRFFLEINDKFIIGLSEAQRNRRTSTLVRSNLLVLHWFSVGHADDRYNSIQHVCRS